MMKPEPSELMRCGAWSESSPPWPCRCLKKSSKNSSVGEPGGRSGKPLTRASTFCEVETLTTASITCSATSAMFSGPRAAAGRAGRMKSTAASAASAAPCRANKLGWQDVKWRDIEVGAPEKGIRFARKVRPSCPRRKTIGGRVGTRKLDWGGKATRDSLPMEHDLTPKTTDHPGYVRDGLFAIMLYPRTR